MKRYFLYTLLTFIGVSSFAQSPKREMRAAWMATVWRIDWPNNVIYTTGNTAQINMQKNSMIRYLDSIQSANMNAVFFQVRSRSDAMYNSSYEPWSSDLVATRGMKPGYDPLAFAIKEAHQRGIELHAWLNPYRYETSANQFSGPKDYRTTHPEWLLNYSNGYSILNPALPEVRQRITDVVREIVTNYDVDGIVFDDYFYAYGGTPADLDLTAQQRYKPSDLNVHDWRRQNVNKMILSVYNMIQQTKPYVTFGVSPFGIWTTSESVAFAEGVPLPQGITGGNMYQEIYCDPVAWLKDGSVDYISPQLYWTTTSVRQDYDVLAQWWADLTRRFGKHFYASHSLSALTASATRSQSDRNENTETISTASHLFFRDEYIPLPTLSPFEKALITDTREADFVTKKADSNFVKTTYPQTRTALNFGPEEIGAQIERNRISSKDHAPGSVFYSIKKLYTSGFVSYLKNEKFTHKALAPAISWKVINSYDTVENLSLNGATLTWDNTDANLRYSVYAIPNDYLHDPATYHPPKVSKFLLGITYEPAFNAIGVNTNTHTLAVAILDRYGNEYAIQLLNQSASIAIPTKLISPANNAEIIFGTESPTIFSWQEVPGAYAYIFEIATNEAFSKMILSRELSTTSFSSALLPDLEEGTTYYWRVKTRKTGVTDGISQIRSFSAQFFKITSPQQGEINVSVQPTVTWTKYGNIPKLSYTLAICTDNSFESTKIVYSVTTTDLQTTIPIQKLIPSKTYYARVTASTSSVSTPSGVIRFTTAVLTPDVPQILLPDGTNGIHNLTMHIEWKEDNRASSYRIEISQSNTFPPRSSTILTTDAFHYSKDYTAATAGTYYIRVKAYYGANQSTEWSEVKMVVLNASAIDEKQQTDFEYTITKDAGNTSQLSLEIAHADIYGINIYNLTGKKIIELTNKFLGQGKYNFQFSLNRGIYVLEIRSKRKKIARKIVI